LGGAEFSGDRNMDAWWKVPELIVDLQVVECPARFLTVMRDRKYVERRFCHRLAGLKSILSARARMFVPARDLLDLPRESVLARDTERFYRLSNDFVAPDPGRDNVLIDIRYSMLPTGVTPMWGIDLNQASATQHAKFRIYRDRSEDIRETFVAMLLGRNLSE